MRPGPRLLLLDTDPGLDDALALAALCASPEVDLKAAIAVGGNVPAARTVRNLRGLLRLFGRADVPVARGLEAPCAIHAADVHGADGLAGLAARLDAGRSPPLRIRGGRGSAVAGLRSTRNAQSPIRNLLNLKPCFPWRRLVRETLRALPDRSVDLLALGPLTDLAALARSEHRLLSRKLRAAVLMAGSILEAGNVAPMVEFNVACDPSAAARVLASGWPIRLVPLDATQCVTFGPELAERLAARGTLVGRLLARFIAHLRAFREPAAQRVPFSPPS